MYIFSLPLLTLDQFQVDTGFDEAVHVAPAGASHLKVVHPELKTLGSMTIDVPSAELLLLYVPFIVKVNDEEFIGAGVG